MCLLVLALRCHPRYPLVFAGNRDEFHARPAAPATWWDTPAGFFAGRDLAAGGTWLGAGRAGRFAVVTNFRDMEKPQPEAPSRGELVPDFCGSARTPAAWRARLEARADRYAGFNLLFGDASEMHYVSNRGRSDGPLPAGVYGLSNHLLDTPWPKLSRVRARFEGLLQEPDLAPDALLEMLADPCRAEPAALPRTGLPPETEHMLSAPFIVSPEYGTRCSSVIMQDTDGMLRFVEQSYSAAGAPETRRDERIRLAGATQAGGRDAELLSPRANQ